MAARADPPPAWSAVHPPPPPPVLDGHASPTPPLVRPTDATPNADSGHQSFPDRPGAGLFSAGSAAPAKAAGVEMPAIGKAAPAKPDGREAPQYHVI